MEDIPITMIKTGCKIAKVEGDKLGKLTSHECLIVANKPDDSQFIISTHSPILMAFPGASILQFDDNGVQEVSYTDTDHYRVTKYFLNNTDQMLSDLGII